MAFLCSGYVVSLRGVRTYYTVSARNVWLYWRAACSHVLCMYVMMISVLLLLFIYFLLKRVGHILEYKPITRDTCQKHDSSEEERCGVAAV